MKKIDLIGQRFGRLTVIEETESNKSGGAQWKCKCDCGNSVIVPSGHLRSGHTKSCGCYRREIEDLKGKRYGRLTVVERAETKNRKTYWKCKCDCGATIKVNTANLNNGHTKSCGCLQKEKVTTHGKKNTKLYKVWASMKARCDNSSHKAYENYGGRGITVCDEWKNDFINFYNWAMENGYQDGLTIDRKDNNGNYEPLNCRWSTQKEQNNNTRRNQYIEFDGECHTIAEWAEIKKINRLTLWDRITRKGWSLERALTTPPGKHRRRNER